MIHRKQHTPPEISLRREGSIHPDGQGLFSNPPLPEPCERIRSGVALLRRDDRMPECLCAFPPPPVQLEHGRGSIYPPADRAPLLQRKDDHRKRSGRHVSCCVSMRQRGKITPKSVRLLYVIEKESDRRHAHHATAPLAVVDRLNDQPHPFRAQGRKARIPRRPPLPEVPYTDEPPVLFLARRIGKVLGAAGLPLRREPPEIRMVHHPGRMTDPLAHPARMRTQESLCREQGHLRVVRDRSAASVGRRIPAYPARPELRAYLRKREELDGCAKSVADGSAKQASPKPRQIIHVAKISRHACNVNPPLHLRAAFPSFRPH